MSRSLLHVKQVKCEWSEYGSIPEALEAVTNQAGTVINYFSEYGPNPGFLWQSNDIEKIVLFALLGGRVVEIQLFRTYPYD